MKCLQCYNHTPMEFGAEFGVVDQIGDTFPLGTCTVRVRTYVRRLLDIFLSNIFPNRGIKYEITYVSYVKNSDIHRSWSIL